MTSLIQQFRRALRRAEPAQAAAAPQPAAAPDADAVQMLDLAPNDPLRAYIQSSPGVLDLDTLRLDSPVLARMRAEGARLVVPLLSQGDLVGLLSLGPRRSEQDYSSDDRALLASLATHAAPALRVAQLVRQQRAEAGERERIAQELRVARLIQQTLLPREVPAVPGWEITPYYEPAREVGGDFYDFIQLPGGQLGLVVADVTDKGVPAALVMATTRSVLRAAASRLQSPGTVLARVNDLLAPDMPPKMFVTCFYAVLDPASGRLHFANAGHDLPYWRAASGALCELRARGMPLGLMEGQVYEEGLVQLGPGDHVLLYSDGLVEAHNARREMFSFGRLAQLVGGAERGGRALVDTLLAELARFTGAGWEQEDDLTLVALSCEALAPPEGGADGGDDLTRGDGRWVSLAEMALPSLPDNERLAIRLVAEAVRDVGLAPLRLERLKTAVGEATMNAMEHGNGYQPERMAVINVRRSERELSVRIFDHGSGRSGEPEAPDLDAKLRELQAPRGWGLHLTRHMVDELREGREDGMHVVELIVRL